MKLKIEKSWLRFFLTGYRYRVTSMEDSFTKNNLFDFKQEREWGFYERNISHLRTDIREWLEESIPWNLWDDEHPADNRHISYTLYPGETSKTCGILFKRKKDILLFKMRWGGNV